MLVESSAVTISVVVKRKWKSWKRRARNRNGISARIMLRGFRRKDLFMLLPPPAAKILAMSFISSKKRERVSTLDLHVLIVLVYVENNVSRVSFSS